MCNAKWLYKHFYTSRDKKGVLKLNNPDSVPIIRKRIVRIKL
jgi:hypothetical protein